MRKSFSTIVPKLPTVLAALIFAVAFSSLRVTAQARPSLNGLWDAVLILKDVQVPFRYEITVKGNQAQGFFFEGERRIASSSGTFSRGELKIQYDHLNTELVAHMDGDTLVGEYHTIQSFARPLAFRAKKFSPVSADSNPPSVAGDWLMSRLQAERTAPRDTRTWTLFLRQAGAEVTGSILRVDGDTGTLSGHFTGGKLVLSHFAGERPTTVQVAPQPDGTLAVTLDGNAHYTAARSKDALAKGITEPPDPSRYTSVQDPTQPLHFQGVTLDGQVSTDADPRYKGKVVIFTIGGSWCPNCHDEAPFLVELYKKYHAKGLEITELSFENSPDLSVARPRMLSFIRRYSIPYQTILMGDPSQLKAKLPQIVNFGAYPTTFYVGRDGLVRSVHAGFASEATGDEHVRLEREITQLVERLLSEPAPKG
jgi:thiol-disulfide isomerase/thioredoxin